MVAFVSSLVNTGAEVKPLAGTAFSLDCGHPALLVVWGRHVTTAAEKTLLAQLRKSDEFQSINR